MAKSSVYPPAPKPMANKPAANSRPEIGLRRRIREHREAAKTSWMQLWLRPFINTMTWLTLAVTLALPGMLIVVLGQMQGLAGAQSTNYQVSVFLQTVVDDKAGQAIAQKLRNKAWVTSAQFISAQQALQEFSQASGLGDIFASLSTNPIPATILIEIVDDASQSVADLAEEISLLPEVDQVILNQEWLERIRILATIAERSVIILTILLALGVVLVMASATRLQLVHHQKEMVVMKLIGGTNTYLRRPFLYSAIWSGSIAGVLACMMMALALLALQSPFGDLAASFNTNWQLHNLSGFHVLITLMGSCTLTLVATLLTVNKQLAAIETS